MRVALFGPTHPLKGGVAQHTTELAHQLHRRGHDVALVSWARPYPARLYPGQLTVEEPELEPFEPVRRRLAWNRPDSWVVEGWLQRTAQVMVMAQVVPFQAVPYGSAIAAAKAGLRRPEVVTVCHNVLPHERHPGDRLLVKALLRASDRVLVHSEAQAALARGLVGRPVASATLPPFFPAAFGAARPRPGVHRRLLFFGLVRPYKGVDVLLRALAEGPPGVRLRVAGEVWGAEKELRNLAASLGVAPRVEWHPGYVDSASVPALFADVDALVLPYREATGSQGVWTAFQFGVPAVVTRVGELGRAVRDGIDGLVAEPGDPGSLAAALDALYRPGVAEQLRAAVRPVDGEGLWGVYIDRLLGG